MFDWEEVSRDFNVAFVTILSIVEYDGYQIFKATLIFQPDVNPFLSQTHAYMS